MAHIGKTQPALAADIGVKPSIVRGLLYGTIKGRSGEAHKGAVLLDLKEGVTADEATPIAAVKAAARA